MTVAVGGGLTLVLQESAEPTGPNRWERSTPAPLLRPDGDTACLPPTPLPTEDGLHDHACIVTRE
ncbi:hypothetical protein [Streptomyces cinereospinus]|uniref:Secreted protein n=1 Tax=Streptomyces cinereospinus TaxID=285561 RepID=A0ABV5MVD2_9ACTN